MQLSGNKYHCQSHPERCTVTVYLIEGGVDFMFLKKVFFSLEFVIITQGKTALLITKDLWQLISSPKAKVVKGSFGNGWSLEAEMEGTKGT